MSLRLITDSAYGSRTRLQLDLSTKSNAHPTYAWGYTQIECQLPGPADMFPYQP